MPTRSAVTKPTLVAALFAAQQEFPVLEKSAVNPHFDSRYTDWASIIRHILPILHKHGFLLSQHPEFEDGTHLLTTQLTHVESGEAIESSIALVGCGNPQQQGSAITYAKRYALLAILGIATDTEDDDGNAASSGAKSQAAPDARSAAKPGGVTAAQLATMQRIDEQRIFPVEDEDFFGFAARIVGRDCVIADLTEEEAKAVIRAGQKLPKKAA